MSRALRSLLFPAFTLVCLARPAAPDLVIQVIRGAGANNNVISGNLATPVVRVVNSLGEPVSGALVVFTAPPSGPSVEFTGTGDSAQAVSDESGTAASPRFKPVGADGQVELRVLAAKDGKSASASIFQMNLGLENEADSPDAIEIYQLPMMDDGAPPSKGTGRRRFRFRVQTGSGKPLAGVPVSFTVRALKRAGKNEEADHFDQTSASDGSVLIIVERNVGRIPIEIAVKAALAGRSATRYFTSPSKSRVLPPAQ